MQVAGLPILNSWQNFILLIGTAAATLTGLMFVVTTLIAEIDRQVTTLDAGISAFNTPTIVHFCAVLLLAGILSAPWQAFWSLGLLIGLLGLGGMVYLSRVMQQMRHIPGYQTPLRDWIWYIVIPFSLYVLLIIAGILFSTNPDLALFLVSMVMVGLLFLGIRNAWDLVTYLSVARSHPEIREQVKKRRRS
jgi:hypothetical protein